jgi:hypothetical protein
MEHLVLVRRKAPNRFTAQSVAFPEVQAEAETEAGAIERVRESLVAWLSSAKLVRVEVPVSANSNPWLDSFGRSANDPDFPAYLEELQRAREADPLVA